MDTTNDTSPKTKELTVVFPKEKLNDINFINKKLLEVSIDTLYHLSQNSDMSFKDLVSRMVPDLSNLDQEFLDKYDLNSKGKLLVDEPKDKEKSSDKTTLDNNIDKNTETIQPKKKISIKKNTEKKSDSNSEKKKIKIKVKQSNTKTQST